MIARPPAGGRRVWPSSAGGSVSLTRSVRSALCRAACHEDRREAHRALAEATDARVARIVVPGIPAPSRGPDAGVAADLERSARSCRAAAVSPRPPPSSSASAELTTATRRAWRRADGGCARQAAGRCDPEGALGLLAVRAGRAPVTRCGMPRAPSARPRSRPPPSERRGAATAARGSRPCCSRSPRAGPGHLPRDALAAGTTLPARRRAHRLRVVDGPSGAYAPASLRRVRRDLLLGATRAARPRTASSRRPAPMQRASRAFLPDDVPAETRLRWGWLAGMVGADAYDYATVQTICERHIDLARRVGHSRCSLSPCRHSRKRGWRPATSALRGWPTPRRWRWSRPPPDATRSIIARLRTRDVHRHRGRAGRLDRAESQHRSLPGRPGPGHHPVGDRRLRERPRPVREGPGRRARRA